MEIAKENKITRRIAHVNRAMDAVGAVNASAITRHHSLSRRRASTAPTAPRDRRSTADARGRRTHRAIYKVLNRVDRAPTESRTSSSLVASPARVCRSISRIIGIPSRNQRFECETL